MGKQWQWFLANLALLFGTSPDFTSGAFPYNQVYLTKLVVLGRLQP
jgi:hypothetical protein